MGPLSLFPRRGQTPFADASPVNGLGQTGSQLTQALACISAAGLVIASAGLGATFAFNAGKEHGLLMAGLMTTFAIALELGKPIAVSSAFTAFRVWAVVRGLALSLLATVAIAYSLTAELMLMATARGDLVAQRIADTKAAKSADGRRERIEVELAKLSNARPSATIRAEVAGILADPRLGDCRYMAYSQRAKAVCPRVNALRAELGSAERRDKLEGDLASLPTSPATAAPAAREADPGAHALSVYLSSVGVVVPASTLTHWLTIVPVLALELGAALSMLLVQSVSGGQRPAPPMQTEAAAPPTKPVDRQTPASTPELQQPGTATVDINSPATRPPRKRARTATERLANRRLGPVTTLTKAAAQAALVDTLKSHGGQVGGTSVRRLASLIGATKSTAHNAIAALIAAGTVARIGGELVLRT